MDIPKTKILLRKKICFKFKYRLYIYISIFLSCENIFNTRYLVRAIEETEHFIDLVLVVRRKCSYLKMAIFTRAV